MNVDQRWWKTALFSDFSLRVGVNPLQPVRARPTVFSVVPAGATHDLIPSRGNRVHLKVNGSPVKMEWIFSSVNYQRDGGRRVCWSEWCLMHSIPTSSFLSSSFCVHHASSDQVLDSCRSPFIPHVISFPSSFIFLPLCLCSWHLDGGVESRSQMACPGNIILLCCQRASEHPH